jgi:hypothetical protein
VSVHPIGTPPGLSPNTGPLASASWLVARELAPKGRWWVEIALETEDRFGHAARFQIEIFSEEWGFLFEHGRKSSWIRITDIPFVHGSDDHALLRETPPLRDIGRLVSALEARFEVSFPRAEAVIRTSLLDSVTTIREWVATI